MPPSPRFTDRLRRSAHAGLALLRATATRPAAPLKINFCLTYWCQYRCKTCNIWQRKPENELSLDEIQQFFEKSNGFNWIDFTGGEVWIRKDFPDIVEVDINPFFGASSPSQCAAADARITIA